MFLSELIQVSSTSEVLLWSGIIVQFCRPVAMLADLTIALSALSAVVMTISWILDVQAVVVCTE